jgi:hypothetical protein
VPTAGHKNLNLGRSYHSLELALRNFLFASQTKSAVVPVLQASFRLGRSV